MSPGHESRGPLTRKPCTWWRYKIEERSSTGRSRGWSTVDSGTSETPFILDDGTGQCLIDPRGAEVFPAAKDVWYGSTEWPEVRIPDGQGFFGKLADLLLSGGRYRYTEYRLQPREPVCALGAFRSRRRRREPGSRGGGIVARMEARSKDAPRALRPQPRRRPGRRGVGSGARGGAPANRRRHGEANRGAGHQRIGETGGRPRLPVVGIERPIAGAAPAPQRDRGSRRRPEQRRRAPLDGERTSDRIAE